MVELGLCTLPAPHVAPRTGAVWAGSEAVAAPGTGLPLHTAALHRTRGHTLGTRTGGRTTSSWAFKPFPLAVLLQVPVFWGGREPVNTTRGPPQSRWQGATPGRHLSSMAQRFQNSPSLEIPSVLSCGLEATFKDRRGGPPQGQAARRGARESTGGVSQARGRP